MRKFKDLTNLKFNKLLVLEFVGKDSDGGFLWKCLCDCGNITYSSTHKLECNRKKSCGCLKISKRIKKHLNNFDIIYDPSGAYVLVELTQGQWTICDIDDWFNYLINYKWYAYKNNRSGFYCRSKEGTKVLQMHRLVLGITDYKIYIDRKNRNSLDNRNQNLRTCDFSQNTMNSKRKNKTGFTGVHFDPKTNKYRAEISSYMEKVRLGYFNTAEEGAKIRDLKALELHNEFAVLNFPKTPQSSLTE